MKKRGNHKNIKTIKEDSRKFLFILARYVILLLLMFSLPIIYFIFTPLTIYPLKWLLDIFFENVYVFKDFISLNMNIFIKIVPACIAGSAYLLLLILNFSVSMSIKKRIYSILLSFSLLLMLNISRIFILISLYQKSFSFFDITHKVFWYFLSTLFVVAIWFFIVKIFYIKEIPVYTDIKFLIENIRS